MCRSTAAPSPSTWRTRLRVSLMRLALNAPANPRLDVSISTAARFFVAGWRSKGKRSARSGEYRFAITSDMAFAYGRAATTRSCARFIFDVATISIVRVILRVFSTDLMRPLSSRPLAIADHTGVILSDAKDLMTNDLRDILRCAQDDRSGAQHDKSGAQDDRSGAQDDRSGAQDDRSGAHDDKSGAQDKSG